MNDTTKWLGITAIVTIVMIGGILLAAKSQPKTSGTEVGTPPAVTAADWSIGNENATTTLIEYGDFQCPFCASVEPMFEQLRKEHSNEVRFVYRHFPLLQHTEAELTVRAAEAAGKQGKFWEMHDKLYATQTDWATKPNAQDLLVGYAKEFGLNVDQFTSDLFADDVTKRVTDAKDEAKNLNLPGTPALFVNGKSVEAPTTYPELLKLLNVNEG